MWSFTLCASFFVCGFQVFKKCNNNISMHTVFSIIFSLVGNSLEIVNEETGKAENVKFDWVPPNVEKTLASRYMELLPPDKRPIAGSEVSPDFHFVRT